MIRAREPGFGKVSVPGVDPRARQHVGPDAVVDEGEEGHDGDRVDQRVVPGEADRDLRMGCMGKNYIPGWWKN